MKGEIAYASQEPWIYSATLRENILFGLPYDFNWYNTVVEACALDKVSMCILVMVTNSIQLLVNVFQWCGNSQSYRTLSDKSSECLVN